MLRDLFQLVFPQHCPGCEQALVHQEKFICLECSTEFRHTGFHRHPQENILYDRLAGRVPIAGASAYLYFDKQGRVKRILQALKYKNQPRLGRFLGEAWGEELQQADWWQSVNALVPVPLHPSRMAERGYNQSEELVRGLAKRSQKEVWNRHLIRREKTSTQTRKGKEERWENVRDVFAVKRPLKGHIALVDDVVTTGATLEACIRTLLEAPSPPAQVTVLSLALAQVK